jgi:Flp pilus assembly secretin CpaC
VVNQASNNVSVLLDGVDGNGNATLTEATNSPISVGQQPVALATGDLNGDGIPDLAVVNQVDNTISVLLGSSNADGTFTAATGSPLPTATTPAGITIANFTGGNTADIAVTNQGVSTLGIYVGLGGGTFSNRIEIQTAAMVSSVLTSSGLPDVALTAQGTTPKQGVVAVIQDSTSFANAGTNSTTQIPYPGSEYIDLGVKVKATPTVHQNNEVTLQLEFEIRALAGASVNGIPVISNRTLSQTIRVKEDETTMLSGLLDREETRAITGLPGIAKLPGVGYAFGNRNNSLKDNEFLILVTPHLVRTPARNTVPIFAGRGEGPTRTRE